MALIVAAVIAGDRAKAEALEEPLGLAVRFGDGEANFTQIERGLELESLQLDVLKELRPYTTSLKLTLDSDGEQISEATGAAFFGFEHTEHGEADDPVGELIDEAPDPWMNEIAGQPRAVLTEDCKDLIGDSTNHLLVMNSTGANLSSRLVIDELDHPQAVYLAPPHWQHE